MSKKSSPFGCCCPVYRIIDLLSKRWNMHILRALAEHKTMRFSDIQEVLPDINSRMLSTRLSDLEENELVTRTVLETKPITIEYAMTEKGKDLCKVFKNFCKWSEKWGETYK